MDVIQQRLPVGATWLVEHDDREQVALASLSEREDLEAFIERTEAAWEKYNGVGLFHEEQLAREEVLEVHELLAIAGNDGVGVLLERQQNVDADAVLATSADMPGFHDAARRAGDDHVFELGHAAAKLNGDLIGWCLWPQARRPEYRDLAPPAVRSEDLEAIAEFLECRGEQFHVAAVGAIADELVGCFLDLLHHLFDRNWRPFLRVRVVVQLLE